jgi:hypothetical protein
MKSILERLVRADPSTGSFIVNNLPEGRYTVRIKPSLSSFQTTDISDNAVKPGVATGLGIVAFVPYEAWSHSRELRLNTGASGAGINGTVTHRKKRTVSELDPTLLYEPESRR